MGRALTLSQKQESRTVRWEAAIRAARMDVPTGAEALKSLTRILAETRQHGYLHFEYEARLALGEAEIRSGLAQLDAFGLPRLSGTVEQAGFSGLLEKLQGPAIGTLEHFRAEPRIPD